MSDVGRVPRGRLAAVALLVLVVQTTVISQVPLFAGAADIVALAAMSVGLLYGSLTGAVFGFGIGLGLDLRSSSRLVSTRCSTSPLATRPADSRRFGRPPGPST